MLCDKIFDDFWYQIRSKVFKYFIEILAKPFRYEKGYDGHSLIPSVRFQADSFATN